MLINVDQNANLLIDIDPQIENEVIRRIHGFE